MKHSSSSALPPPYSLTLALPSDLPLLHPIERAAARMLAGHIPDSHLEGTTDEEELKTALRQDLLWVVRCAGQPVGFALVEILARDTLHLEEIDVHPDHGRRGLGAALVRVVCEAARERGYQAVTLTTFRDIPWNMPFYARLGFAVVPVDGLTPELRALVADETTRGLDSATRVVMRYRVAEV